MLVLFYHYFHKPNQGGAIGVGLFFCISGYIITSILLSEFHKSGRINLKRFYLRRAQRLLPLAYLVIILNILTFYTLNYFELLAVDIKQLLLSSIYCIFYVGNLFGYFGNGYTALSESLVPFWSLGVEEQFYAFWPLLLIFFIRKVRSKYMYSALVTLIGMSIVFHSISQYIGKTVWTFPLTYFDILFSGCLIAILESEKSFKIPARFLMTAKLIGFILAFCIIIRGTLPTDFLGQGYTLNYLVELTLFMSLYKSQIIAKSRVLVSMGDMSYSLYCIHFPILTLGNIFLSDSIFRLPVIIVVTFLLAYLSHRFFERLFWIPSYQHKSTRITK